MSNEYKDWLDELKNAPVDSEDYNRYLLMKYPWLRVREGNCYGEPEQAEDDFTHTWLSNMPIGWQIAFGDQMCKEIDQLLRSVNFQDEYKLAQVKEKYGSLRWYEWEIPEAIREEYGRLILKYMELSEHTCAGCGKPAVYMSKGWICPWCEDCAHKIGGSFFLIGTNDEVFFERVEISESD